MTLLDKVSVGVFNQALQNLATLLAENGGSVSRLQFSQEAAAQQRTNLEAANGRIVDVDIASESTTLAKYNICSSIGIHARTGKQYAKRSPYALR